MTNFPARFLKDPVFRLLMLLLTLSSYSQTSLADETVTFQQGVDSYSGAVSVYFDGGNRHIDTTQENHFLRYSDAFRTYNLEYFDVGDLSQYGTVQSATLTFYHTDGYIYEESPIYVRQIQDPDNLGGNDTTGWHVSDGFRAGANFESRDDSTVPDTKWRASDPGSPDDLDADYLQGALRSLNESYSFTPLTNDVSGTGYLVDVTQDILCIQQNTCPNQGWALFHGNDNANIQYFTGTSNHSNTALRPKLVIVFADSGSGNNTPPTVTNPGTQTHVVGSSVSLHISAGDVENDPLTFTANGLPGGLSINNTGLITGSVNTANSYSVTINVSDGTDTTAMSFSWNVTTSGGGGGTSATLTFQQGVDSYSGAVSVYLEGGNRLIQTDQENHFLRYSDAFRSYNLEYFDLGDLSSYGSVQSATLTFYHADGNIYEESPIYVRQIQDPDNLGGNDTTGWHVSDGFRAGANFESRDDSTIPDTKWRASDPDSPDDLNADYLQGTLRPLASSYSFTPLTNDAVGTAYSVDVTQDIQCIKQGTCPNQGWALFHTNTAANIQYFTATSNHSTSTLRPKLVITFGSGSGSGNTAPSVTNPGTQDHTVGNSVSLQIGASDADNDPLSFSASGLPDGLSISNSGLITGTPTVANSYNVTINVSDGTDTTAMSFSWNVTTSGGGGTSATLTFQQGVDGYNGAVSVYFEGGNRLILSDQENHFLRYSDAFRTYNLEYFDLGDLSSYGSVQSAILTFYHANPDGYIYEESPIYVRQIQDPDNLGDSYSTGWKVADGFRAGANFESRDDTTVPDIKWRASDPSSPDDLGADYLQGALRPLNESNSFTPLTNDAVGTSYTVDVTQDIQCIKQDTCPNQGWALFHENTAANIQYFTATSNHSTSTLRPKLVITFGGGSGSGNTAPSVTNPGTQTHTVGSSVSLQIGASDTDNDPLSFSASDLPNGLSISNSGLITGTPTVANGYSVTINVSDGTDTSAMSFSWNVTTPTPNTAPVITNPGTQTSVVGESISLQIGATDAESDPLNFTASGLPSGLSISNSGLITGTLSTASNYNITVNVSDGTNTTSLNFNWTVDVLGGGVECSTLDFVR